MIKWRQSWSTWIVWVHSLKARRVLGAVDAVAAKMVDVGLRLNAAIGQSPVAKIYWGLDRCIVDVVYLFGSGAIQPSRAAR